MGRGRRDRSQGPGAGGGHTGLSPGSAGRPTGSRGRGPDRGEEGELCGEQQPMTSSRRNVATNEFHIPSQAGPGRRRSPEAGEGKAKGSSSLGPGGGQEAEGEVEAAEGAGEGGGGRLGGGVGSRLPALRPSMTACMGPPNLSAARLGPDSVPPQVRLSSARPSSSSPGPLHPHLQKRQEEPGRLLRATALTRADR